MSLSTNLAVQSVSQSVKKNLPNVQNERGGVKGVLNNVKKTARLVERDIPQSSIFSIVLACSYLLRMVAV